MSDYPTRILLAASGDLRASANTLCWPTQLAMENRLIEVLKDKFGVEVERVHQFDSEKGHGFLDSQRAGLEAFSKVDSKLPVIVAESVWQYSHHILGGLLNHQGPILTVANWSGQWPGLVGLLNLNAGLTKAGREFTTVWSEDFNDELLLTTLETWLKTGKCQHQLGHVQLYIQGDTGDEALGVSLAEEHMKRGIMLGVFDEGCMGMYNAIIPDEMLFSARVFKERLSQSALLFEMSLVTDIEAEGCLDWLLAKGMTFHFGPDAEKDLTREQVLGQCRMYIAAGRMADEFGCDALGIQYQLGLKDMAPASDLAEGLFNNSDRPPITRMDGTIIREGEPYVHFNEVDECAGLDGLMTFWVHKALGQPVENTLHDLRWADNDASGTVDDYVWVFEISGAAPPAHHIGGYAGTHGYRQAAMYFPGGGATCSGVAKPGDVIWSRIYVKPDGLHMDIGLARAIELPEEETQRRLDSTTPVWPIMHAVLEGVTRDQMMARHCSNHIQVAYANSYDEAKQCLRAKAACATRMGIRVHLCGVKTA
jgi:hypothetical protein